MSNIHDRWDGAPRMNSKERFAKSHARGYGGSAFRDDDGWYASIEALNSIELELQRNQRNISRSATLTNPFARSSSPWRVSSGSFVLIVLQQGSRGTVSNSKGGGVQPKDMRSKIQQHIDSRMRSSIDSFYDKCKWPGSFASQKQLPVAPVQNSTTLRDALFTMNGCIVLVISGAQAGVHIMKSVELPLIIRRIGKGAGLLGLVDNSLQLIKDPNWNDGLQIVAQGGLILYGATLGAPIVLGGGVVLFVWELAE